MAAVQRYQQRISGPLLDRIDIHLKMVRVPFQKLASLEAGESSAAVRARVEGARQVQEERFRQWGKPGVLVNGDVGPAEVQAFCDIDDAGRNLLRAHERVVAPIQHPRVFKCTGERSQAAVGSLDWWRSSLLRRFICPPWPGWNAQRRMTGCAKNNYALL